MGNRARERVGTLRAVAAAAGIGLGLGALLLGGCNNFTSFLSRGAAYKPKSVRKVDLAWDQMRLFAGDMNFHYAPPDDVTEVRRDQKQSMELLDKSELDFVIVTPKLKARFWENSGELEKVYRDWQVTSQAFSSMGEGHPLLFLGAEYHDDQWGSASLIASDFAGALGELSKLSRDQLKSLPNLLFEYVKLQRGLVVLNTPLATPLKVPFDSPLKYARTDRSWRPLSRKGLKVSELPKDIQWLNANYNAMEAYSVPVSIWRDKYVLEDELASTREVLALADKTSLQLNRRILTTAGTDSRGRLVRATIFVAAPERSKDRILDGLRAGRVCLRSPTACTARMYADGSGLAMHVGGAVSGAKTVEFAWPGEGQLYRNGELVDTFTDRTRTQPARPGVCDIYRVHVDNGFSGPFYVNCDLMQ